MAKKKKKKPLVKKEEIKQETEPTEIQEVPLICTCVGQKMAPAGAGFVGVVKSQRYIPSLGKLLVYFDNGYICNAQVCKVIEEEKNEQKNNSKN